MWKEKIFCSPKIYNQNDIMDIDDISYYLPLNDQVCIVELEIKYTIDNDRYHLVFRLIYKY